MLRDRCGRVSIETLQGSISNAYLDFTTCEQTVEEDLEAWNVGRNNIKMHIDGCPNLPIHGCPGGVLSVERSVQVDQPNNGKGTGWNLKSESRYGLEFLAGCHLKRLDNDNGECEDNKTADHVENGVEVPESQLNSVVSVN